MNIFIKLFIGLLIITGTGILEKNEENLNKKPNIIFILSDDHTTNAISAYGGLYKDIAPTPNIDKIANDFSGKVVVGKVNVDNERDIAAKYNVRGIPNLLVFNAGEPQEQLVGNVPENQIVDILNKFI